MIHVGVAAHSESSNREVAERFVSRLTKECRLILGGYWGLMKDVADAAFNRGMQVVFILPENPIAYPPKNEYSIPINTGLDYRGRSVILVKSSSVLVTLGGESGTITELFIAYSYGIPTLILRNTGFATDWLEKAFKNRLDNRGLAPVIYVDTPEELAERAIELAKRLKT